MRYGNWGIEGSEARILWRATVNHKWLLSQTSAAEVHGEGADAGDAVDGAEVGVVLAFASLTMIWKSRRMFLEKHQQLADGEEAALRVGHRRQANPRFVHCSVWVD